MRNWPWKGISLVVVLALGAYLTIGVILAGRDTPPIPPQSPILLDQGQVRGNRITTKSWSFDYKKAQLSPEGTIGTVDGVRNGIIFRKGKPFYTISAEHISVNVQSLDFDAIGKVHVERVGDQQHRAFETDLVEWTNGAKLLSMPHPSYVTTGGQRLQLDGITVDFTKDEVHFGKIGGSVEIKK